MNNENLIWNRWKKEQGIFDCNLSLLKKKINTEAIHDIRVSIKKLRAVFKIYIQLSENKTEPGLLDGTEELFTVLGKERDIEICLELIRRHERENNCRYPEFRQFLQWLLKKSWSWSSQSLSMYQKKELKGIAALLEKDSSLDDEKKLVQNIQQILMARLLETKSWFRKPHKLRQGLKDFYHGILLLPTEPAAEMIDMGKLHHILDELGNWQDNETLLTRVKHFRKDYLPASLKEAADLKTLEDKLETEKEVLRKSALTKTRSLLKQAGPNS